MELEDLVALNSSLFCLKILRRQGMGSDSKPFGFVLRFSFCISNILKGGEVVPNNIILVLYRSSQRKFKDMKIMLLARQK